MTLKTFLKKKKDTIDIKATLQEVVELMNIESIKYVVFVDSHSFPLGILTEQNIVNLYHKGYDFPNTLAYDFSAKQLVKAHSDRRVEYALNLMVDHLVRRVVVIDDAQRYVGVVEQDEVVFAFESIAAKSNIKMFELLLNESKAQGVDKDTSLKDTLEIMYAKSLGSILVRQDGKAIGILTESDIVKLAKDDTDKDLSVWHFMQTPICKVSLKASLKECVKIMRDKKIRRILVEDKDADGKIVDYIITTKDIINNLQGNYAKFLESKLASHRVTFDSLSDFVIEVYDFGSSQVISWMNNAAKKSLNIGIDDPITKIIPPYIFEESLDHFKRSRAHNIDRVEISGKVYRYSATAVELFDTRVIKIILSDFTELYLSNKKLVEQVDVMSDSIYEQEQMQKEVINQKAVGIGYLSPEGKILFVNEYINDLLGYKNNELIGQNIVSVTDPEDISISLNQRNTLKSTEKNSEVGFEKRYIRKDGESIWVHVSLSASKDQKGNVKYFIGFVKDISQRKLVEQRLRQSAAVFDNTKEGIVITDDKIHILAVNSAFCEILGYSEDECLGNKAQFLRSHYHDGEFYRNLWRSIRKNGYWKGEMWSVRKSGETFPQWLNISTVLDENGKVSNYVGVISDISMIKQSEEELEFLAHHDPLTQLPNRLLLTARLEQAIKNAKRNNTKLAVFFLDLDRFKEINDTFGHSYGDQILKIVTERFEDVMRERDTIARIGGDEFVFLIEDINSYSDVEPVLTKILETFNKTIIVNNHPFDISASIGVSIYPEDGENIEDLIKNADAAMYQAKEAGRNTYRFYAQEMTESLFTKIMMKNEIEKALRNKEFICHYQPQVSLQSQKILGFEVLVRWEHPDMGLLYPDKFITIAEQTNQIAPLGKLVMQMACAKLKEWLDDKKIPTCKVALNISAAQIQHDNIYELVIETLEKTGLSGAFVELELTESYMMDRPQEAITLFKKLKNHGITMAIDDFGTGYSSLSYLKQLPIDKLKIDRSFVQDLPNDKGDVAITTTIIAMAKSLGMSVIAEGIETKKQHDFLKEHGCYEGQGYYYAKPMPEKEFLEFVKKHS